MLKSQLLIQSSVTKASWPFPSLFCPSLDVVFVCFLKIWSASFLVELLCFLCRYTPEQTHTCLRRYHKSIFHHVQYILCSPCRLMYLTDFWFCLFCNLCVRLLQIGTLLPYTFVRLLVQ